MPKKPVNVGEMRFASKGDAVRFFREMLNRYKPGDEVSAHDAALLRPLLTRHPQAEEKAGCGVAGFKVRSAEYDTQCFWVVRTDGTTERFSFYSCI